MNYTHLVENGTYSKDTLRESQRRFVDGLEYAIEEIHSADANLFEVCEDDSRLDQMIAEIKSEAAEEIADWLYGFVCEYIVCMNDENEAEDEEQ